MSVLMHPFRCSLQVQHGRAGTKAAAIWVNKRAKFDATDLDEAALKSDDDSGGPE